MLKNAEKMVQLTPNSDKRCILGCFINFQNFENFRPFLADFLRKQPGFFKILKKIKNQTLDENPIQFLNFWPNYSIFGINVPWHSYENVTTGIFFFSRFCDFMGPEIYQKGRFLAKFDVFAKKRPFWRISAPIKQQKREIEKICKGRFS